jgi:hypothetical protein
MKRLPKLKNRSTLQLKKLVPQSGTFFGRLVKFIKQNVAFQTDNGIN